MRLKQLRKERKLKQIEVSEAINCSQAVYSRYESGERAMSMDTLKALAAFYGVSTDYLLGVDDAVQIASYDLSEPPKHTAPPIDPHTYYAEKFGPETQRIVDELLAKLQAMPEDRREDAAKGALTFVRGLESEAKGSK